MADNETSIETNAKITGDSKQFVSETNKAVTSLDAFLEKLTKLESEMKSVESAVNKSADAMSKFSSSGDSEKDLEIQKEKTKQMRAQAKEQQSMSDAAVKIAEANERSAKATAKAKIESSKGTDLGREKATPEYQENKRKNDAQNRALQQARIQNMADMKIYRDMHDRYAPKNIWGNTIGETGRRLSSSNDMVASFSGGTLQVLGSALKSPVMGFASFLNVASRSVEKFAQDVTQAYGNIEKLQIQMGVVYGSQSQANTAFSGIQKYAVKSPFGVEQTTEMAILLKQSGVYGSELLDTMKMIGDVSGGNNEKMKRIANNYAQIEAIGKASMLDMRQFAYAGIPIYKEVAKQLGVSQTTLRQMISDGKVTSDVMEKVFKNMTSVGGEFYKSVEKGSKTLSARLQNMQDAKLLMEASAGEFAMNIGNSNGSGGVINSLLDFEEGVYQGVKKALDEKNIGAKEKQAEVNQEEVKSLINSIEELEKSGVNETAINSLRETLEKLTNYTTSDSRRALYAESGNNKIGYQTYSEALETRLSAVSTELDKIQNKQIKVYDFRAVLDLQSEESKLIDLINRAHPTSELTNEEKIAVAESNLEASSQSAADSLSKLQSQADSATNVLSEYHKAIQNTPEYKQKLINDKTKEFNDFQKTAKDFSYLKKDKYGNYDLSGLKLDQMQKFANTFYTNPEAFNYNSDNFFDYGKSKEGGFDIWEEQRKITSNSLKAIQGDLITRRNDVDAQKSIEASKDIAGAMNILSKDISKLTERDITNLSLLLDRIQKELYKIDPKLSNAFTTTGLVKGNADLNAILSMSLQTFLGSGAESIGIEPLWKRIIASSTGMDITKMSGNAYDIMGSYSKISQRNTVANALGAMLTTGGENNSRMSISDVLKNIQSLGSSQNNVYGQKKEKTSYYQLGPKVETQQLDWNKIEKNMMNAALSGRMNAAVIKALRSGYEQQQSTYDKLFISALSTGEQGNYSRDIQDMMKNAYSGININERGKIETSQGVISLNEKGEWFNESTGEIVKDLGSIQGALDNLNRYLNEYYPQIILKINELSVAEQKKKLYDSVVSLPEKKYDKGIKYIGRGMYYGFGLKDNSQKGEMDTFAANNGLQDAFDGTVNEAVTRRALITKSATKNPTGEIAGFLGTDAKSSIEDIGNAIDNLNIDKFDELSDSIMKADNFSVMLSTTMTNLGTNMGEIGKNVLVSSLTDTWETLGESIKSGSNALDNVGNKMREIGRAALSNLGNLLVQAGLTVIASSVGNWPGIFMGMGLIAAGGMSSLVSGLMSDSSSSSSTDDSELSKLNAIKEDLSDLLSQAREDAIYYENTLRHQNALSQNSTVSSQNGTSVNDAIIAPNGNVISTHPNDWLVATKDPGALLGSNTTTSSPNVNISIQNNSGQQLAVKKQEKDDKNGNIDIVAVIEQVAGQYIASAKSDDAFSARQARNNGHSVVA